MTEKKGYPDEKAWVRQEREKVLAYLTSQRCKHAGVGEWPAFHVDPYVALWAVQSPTTLGRIGWWAISGDLPTDYMNSSSGYHPRDALRHFSAEWLSVAESMRRGEEHPRTKMGTPELWPNMAPLLEKRAQILREYADDDGLMGYL
jgi:hypothetical protein